MPGGFLNRAIFQAASAGTGDFVAASAVTGYLTPAQADAVNAVVYNYIAYLDDLSEWEFGSGAYTSASVTAARTTILKSSNAGAAVNFSSAPKVIYGPAFADDLQPIDADLTALAEAGNSAVLAATTASFLTTDESKLDAIEALADVTDAANVASAGAIMASLVTTQGDIIFRNATVPARLAKGTEGQVLTMGANDPAWATASEGLAAATQAEMETGTSTLVASTPGRQHFHPGHPKCWGEFGISADIFNSYNITSITDTGTGQVTVTIATDFSTANWACFATASNMSGSVILSVNYDAKAAGSVLLKCVQEGAAGADPTVNSGNAGWSFAGLGDHA